MLGPFPCKAINKLQWKTSKGSVTFCLPTNTNMDLGSILHIIWTSIILRHLQPIMPRAAPSSLSSCPHRPSFLCWSDGRKNSLAGWMTKLTHPFLWCFSFFFLTWSFHLYSFSKLTFPCYTLKALSFLSSVFTGLSLLPSFSHHASLLTVFLYGLP